MTDQTPAEPQALSAEGWEDFEPRGPRETMAYALMVAGVALVAVEDDDRVGLDYAAADRVLEALDAAHPADCQPECFDADCTRRGCQHHRALRAATRLAAACLPVADATNAAFVSHMVGDTPMNTTATNAAHPQDPPEPEKER